MKIVQIQPDQDYLLLAERLWDGLSPGPAARQAVFITNGVISRVMPREAVYEGSANAQTIDLGQTTLMPGLVDCHVHFSMNCENLFQAIDDWEKHPARVHENARQAAMDYLTSGVLGVRDGSDRMNIGLETRNSINCGAFPGPVVAATGRAIYKKGKYGAFLGPGVSSAAEAFEQIDILKREGINQLKVVVSGLVSFKNFGYVGPVQFTVEELTAIVERAHSVGLMVMAHASSADAVETAVTAGVDSIEHGYFLKKSQLKLMANRNTAWVPTLAPLGNLIKENHLPYEGADMEVIRRSLEIQQLMVTEAYHSGVKLGLGTDAGANQVPHGYSYRDELSYYAAAGLPVKDILRLATSVSAEITGLGGLMGTVTPGKKPYLIAVPGNPFKSPAAATNPNFVIMPRNEKGAR